MPLTTRLLGDTAFVVEYDADEPSAGRAAAAAAALRGKSLEGIIEIQPAFSSVTVYYDPLLAEDWRWLAERVRATMAGVSAGGASRRLVEIPVIYGGSAGPDLETVAARAGLPEEAVIALHTGAEYLASAVGFVPGFAYLEGVPERIQASRRPTPRTAVPAGSVAIGGRYTGVYPSAVPGGWNLIGQTALRLFDPTKARPALIAPGDRVRFRAVTSPVK